MKFVPPQVEQLQYNVLARDKVERDFPPVRRDLGLGLTTWSPLCFGLLTGRYDHGVATDGRLGRRDYAWLRAIAFGSDQDAVLHRVRRVNRLAFELGTTPNRLALAWVLRNRGVDTAITGASNPAQLRDNVEALAFVPRIDDSVLHRIDDCLDVSAETPM